MAFSMLASFPWSFLQGATWRRLAERYVPYINSDIADCNTYQLPEICTLKGSCHFLVGFDGNYPDTMLSCTYSDYLAQQSHHKLHV